MIVKKSNNCTVLEDEHFDIKRFANYLSRKIPVSFETQNVLVDLLKYENLTLEQLLLFIDVSNAHRIRKQSFIIINNAIDPDILPDEIMVVPTLQEGEDMIEMEEIERDLGL
jgi:hypothetical protein